LPPAALQSVLGHIAASENNHVFNRAVGVSCSCKAKLRLSMQYWAAPYLPRTVRLRFVEHLDGHPRAYLKEMQDFLYEFAKDRVKACEGGK
jgi:hypothetical protein